MVACEIPKRSATFLKYLPSCPQQDKIYCQNLVVQLSVMSHTPILQAQLTSKTTLTTARRCKKLKQEW